jgi:hypothetical protein
MRRFVIQGSNLEYKVECDNDLEDCGRASRRRAKSRSDTVRNGEKGKSGGRSDTEDTQDTTYCIEQTLL